MLGAWVFYAHHLVSTQSLCVHHAMRLLISLRTSNGVLAQRAVLTVACNAKLIREMQLEVSTSFLFGEAGTVSMVKVESSRRCKYVALILISLVRKFPFVAIFGSNRSGGPCDGLALNNKAVLCTLCITNYITQPLIIHLLYRKAVS